MARCFWLILLLVMPLPLFGQADEGGIPYFPSDVVAPTWTEYFEAETPTWMLLHAENPVAMIGRQRTPADSMQGRRSEAIGTKVLNGSCAVFGHSVGFPLVIEDLTPTLWVKTHGDGVALGAQVVLPNSIHPETGRPVTFIIPGEKHSGSGRWECLGFRDAQGRNSLAREVWRRGKLFRAEMGRNLNLDGCYLRQIVLFVEAPLSRTEADDPLRNVLVDALEISGHVAIHREIYDRFEANRNGDALYLFDPINFDGFRIESSLRSVYLGESVTTGPGGSIHRSSPITSPKGTPLAATPQGGVLPGTPRTFPLPDRDPRIRSVYADSAKLDFSLTGERIPLDGSVSPAALMQIRLSDKILSINNLPIGVRAVEYNGEPLAFLRELKFNTVWVKDATPELLKEAQDAGVWLICPPPSINQLRAATVYGRDSAASPLADPIYDNVLAWNLGDECTNPTQENNAISQWSLELQRADRGRRRPIICTPLSGVREYGGRIANILMMRRDPILSTLEMNELARWQRGYSKLARPNTPFWGTVQTQPSPKLTHQWIMYEGNPQYMCTVSYEQMKMQVYQGLAAGVHGFLFTSQTPLNGNDPETEYRRTALELLNWELQLIEEWFAEGEVVASYIPSNRPHMGSALIKARRSRLMVPLWTEPKSQLAVGPAFVGNVRYVVPAPETYSAFHLVPGRLLPLESNRVAGGMEVVLEEANLNSLILFSDEDAMQAHVGKRAMEFGERAAFLACKLADLQLAMTEQVLNALKRAKDTNSIPSHPDDHLPLITVMEHETLIHQTKDAIDRTRELLRRSPPACDSAFLQAEKATRGLRLVSRNLLLEATRHELNTCMTPTSVSFSCLPYYLTAYQRLRGARPGQNKLPGGDMDDIRILEQNWRVTYHDVEGVAPPRRALSSKAARNGAAGLQLVVAPLDVKNRPEQLETIPIWVSTPPVETRMGEMICVSGWVRIPQALESTVDGFMVFDSLGGEALALRFLETRGQWREFVFYRVIPADGPYYVFFALGGFGEVHLDDVNIASVYFELPATPAPPVPTPQSPTPWQRFNPLPYILPQRPLFGGGNN